MPLNVFHQSEAYAFGIVVKLSGLHQLTELACYLIGEFNLNAFHSYTFSKK